MRKTDAPHLRGAPRIRLSGSRFLPVERGIDIVNVLLVHFFLGNAQPFAKALEMNDLSLPQEFDHVVDVRVVAQTQDIVIGDPGFCSAARSSVRSAIRSP